MLVGVMCADEITEETFAGKLRRLWLFLVRDTRQATARAEPWGTFLSRDTYPRSKAMAP